VLGQFTILQRSTDRLWIYDSGVIGLAMLSLAGILFPLIFLFLAQ